MPENKAVKEISDLLHKYNMTSTALSINLNIVPPRMFEIMNQRRRISPNTDLRLCKFFKKKPGHFLTLQIDYDIQTAQEKMEDLLKEIKTVDKIPTSMKF